ncbi:hypothetical protein [Fusobacterium vincentii]|uniref:hypothetical protein n=1 Tax=Fusobacterium vincentii TaxID=155615 RepID=UPI0030CD3A56
MSISKVHCLHCDKKIGENEKFIFVNENEVYCRDCVEEESITTYQIMGDYVGDENNTEEYDSIKEFEKTLKDEIERWEEYLKDYENVTGERAEEKREFYRYRIRKAKEKYKEYFE